MDPCLQLRSVKVNWALEVWKNNATLSLFADPVIAGVQFSFQLFYQQLTEADRNHFDPNSFCLRCGNLAEERGLEFQRSKWHQYNFAFRVFSLFSFSQVPLNGFLGLFCTWVSLNIWPPTGLKDLIGFFFFCVCVWRRLVLLSSPWGSASLENGPIQVPSGTEFPTELRPHWSNAGVREEHQIRAQQRCVSHYSKRTVENLDLHEIMCATLC